jgi:hypothetical protein
MTNIELLKINAKYDFIASDDGLYTVCYKGSFRELWFSNEEFEEVLFTIINMNLKEFKQFANNHKINDLNIKV